MGKSQNSSRECSVPMCSSVSGSTRNVTYFSFPTNPIHQKIWAKLISRRERNGDLWMPSQSSKVCSLHFVETDFRLWADYKRLLPNAIPTVFPGYPLKIRKRQTKIIENFRKNYPLGVETPVKPSTSSKKTIGRLDYKRISQEQGNEGSRICSSESNSDTERASSVKKTRGDTPDQESNMGESQVPQKHSEESKPFKKRRVETEAHSNGVFEPDSGTENSKQSESISSKELEKQKNANSHQKSDGENKFGRGMRAKKRSVKIEYDSEEITNESQTDGDYTPSQNPKRRLLSEVAEDLNELKQSQSTRKIVILEQRIRWKEEQMFNLNQKAVRERNARIKAENELEALRNSMNNDGMTIPEGLHEPGGSVSEPQTQEDDVGKDQDDIKDGKRISSEKDTAKSNWTKMIKSLKQEIMLKDKQLAKMNNTALLARNEKVASGWEPKNRLTRNLMRILEDSMSGDAKALFLLEQIECYGVENVRQFRMSTIKKCIEWKLVNMRGYEAVKNMGILTLPSTKVLRNHVDILADTGVTAVEEVSLENDVAEVMQEMGEEGSPGRADEDDSSNISSKLRKTSGNGSQSEFEEELLNEDVSTEQLLQIISETKQQAKRELGSNSSMEDEHKKMKKWMGMKEKDKSTKIVQPVAGASNSAEKELQTVKSRQMFGKKMRTGEKGNAASSNVNSVADLEGRAGEAVVDITDIPADVKSPGEKKVTKVHKPTRSTGKIDPASGKAKSSEVASEVLHDGTEHDYAEPVSEDTDPTYMIESSEDSIESTS